MEQHNASVMKALRALTAEAVLTSTSARIDLADLQLCASIMQAGILASVVMECPEIPTRKVVSKFVSLFSATIKTHAHLVRSVCRMRVERTYVFVLKVTREIKQLNSVVTLMNVPKMLNQLVVLTQSAKIFQAATNVHVQMDFMVTLTKFARSVTVLNANVNHHTPSLAKIVYSQDVPRNKSVLQELNVFQLQEEYLIAPVQKVLELSPMDHVLILMNA